MRDLLPTEIGASAEDLDQLFSAFGTAGIEVIAAADQNFAALDKIPGEKKFDTEAPPKKASSWISLQVH